jgi:hypothetical protein
MATTKVSKGLIKDEAVTIQKLNNELVVTEAEGILNNDNDITVPTSAAVIDYVSGFVPAAADSNFVFIDVKNETGVEIPLGTGCMAVGTDGNSGHILVAPFVADGSVQPRYYIGVLEETIQNGEFGRVVTQGEVNQINTTAFLDGDVLWCDPANPGGFTKNEPAAPAAKLATAIVLNSSTNGKIFVRVQGNEGLHELHDVNAPEAALQNDDVLYWDAINGYWSHKQINIGSGDSGSIPIWNADGTLGQSGFTQVGTSVVFSQPGGANFLMLDSQGAGSHIMLDGFSLGSVDPVNGVMMVANGALVQEFNFNITSIANSYLSINPAADTLTINSTTGEGQILMSQGELSVPNTVTASSFITTAGVIDSTAAGEFQFNADNGNVQPDSKFTFRIDGTERMRIAQGGNVGIGTTNPRAKLEVTNQSYLKEIWNENGLYFGSFAEAAANTYIFGEGANTGAQYLEFGVNFTPRMRINDGGDINIYNGIISGTAYSTSATVAATDLNFKSAQVFTKTITGDTTFTFSNTQIGMVKDFILTGGGAAVLTWPVGTKLAAGTYDGTVSNLIQILVVGAGDYWLTISQPQ